MGATAMPDAARTLIREARSVTLRRFEEDPDTKTRQRLAAALVALEEADEKRKSDDRPLDEER